MIEADAVVLGAGPAGATAALNLAPFRRVLLLEQRPERSADAIGESLPGAAHRLLRDMRLWEGFRAGGHLPCSGRTTVWGTPEPVASDAIRDPDGPGWHLDRARFVASLRSTAADRGAALLSGAEPAAIRREGDGWRLEVAHRGRRLPVRTRLVVDARGRGARTLPGAASARSVEGRLVCGWIVGAASAGGAEPASTRSDPDGWWYEAPLPGGRRLVAFHTDADLPAAAEARAPARLAARAARVDIAVGTLLRWGYNAAHGARATPGAGPGWMAVGDAGLCFEPLASQGLFNALYTGLAGAEAAHRALDGDRDALAGYAASLDPVWTSYARRLAGVYARERRWPHAPFWSRRAEGAAPEGVARPAA